MDESQQGSSAFEKWVNDTAVMYRPIVDRRPGRGMTSSYGGEDPDTTMLPSLGSRCTRINCTGKIT